jgi:hypothetical protein
MSLISRAASLLCVASLILIFSPRLTGAQLSEARAGEAPPNSIQVAVNGALKKTWTADELMGGRFDWNNPKGKFRPAVPLTYALTFKEAGIALDAITELRVIGKKEKLNLSGPALGLLKELLLMVNIDRAGAWKFAVRTQEAEDRLRSLVKPASISVEAIHRIEVSTGSRAGSKNRQGETDGRVK